MSRKNKTPPKPKPPTGHWVENIIEGLRKNLGWLLGFGALLLTAILVPSWLKYSQKYQEKIIEGQLYLDRGLYPKAKASFEEAAKLFPLRKIAGLSKVLGDSPGQGIEQLAELISWDTQAQWGLQMADTFAGEDVLQVEIKAKALIQTHPDSADIRLLLGRFHISHQDFKKASEDYQAALDLDKNNAEAHFGLGYVRWLEGDLPKAEVEYQAAHYLDAKSVGYALNLAGIKAERGDYQQALDLYRPFEQSYPEADLDEALILLKSGQIPEAAGRLQLALELLNSPEITKARENQLPWQSKTDQDLVSLVTEQQKRAYLYFLLALSEYLQGNSAKAKVTWQQGLAASPEQNIRELLRFEVNRLANDRPEWKTNLAGFLSQFK